MPPPVPALGEDVTDLMTGSAVPPIGADVSHLMTPTFRSTNEKDVQGNAVVARASNMLSSLAPTAGGVIGSIVGGVPGAAVGGAAGEGYRQLLTHASELPGAVVDVARNLVQHPRETIEGFNQGATQGVVNAGLQGAGQAAGQAIGAGVASAGGTMAKWLMNRATTRVSAKLMADFPELSDTLIDNALTVSKGGYEKARGLLLAAKAKATVALSQADKSGSTIPLELTSDLADSLKTAVLEKAIKSGSLPPVAADEPLAVASKRLDATTKGLFDRIDSALTNGSPLGLKPTQADLLKTQLQKESRLLYANRTAPNGARAMGMDATERAEYAARLNTAIDQVATGYKAGNAEAQPLIGAVRGIKQAIRPNGNLYQAMVRPAVGMVLGEEAGRSSGHPVAGAMAGAALTSPAMLSREAIVLGHPTIQAILSQLPKPAAQALVDFFVHQLPGLLQAPPEPGASQPPTLARVPGSR